MLYMEFFTREESNRNFTVTQLNGCYAGGKKKNAISITIDFLEAWICEPSPTILP